MGFKHPSHGHLLSICWKEGEVSCGGCKQPVDGAAYGCGDGREDCKYCLHFSCATIHHHLLHPQHPLVPTEGYLDCVVCEHSKDPSFSCKRCDFSLCEDCLSQEPCSAFDYEKVLFVLVDPVTVRVFYGDCLACDKWVNDTRIFKSAEPRRNTFFHVHCVPFELPRSTEHPCHHHPLTFTKKYFDPSIDGCYCDVCEEWRDPEHPVYHCPECKFSAHTSCALSEALPSLTAEWRAGGGQLRGGWRHSFLPDDYYHLKRELESLNQERASQKYWVESLTRELNTMEEDYARCLASAAGRESGLDDHE